MEEQAFAKYYIDPISLGAEDQAAPMPHLYKQMATLRIQPEEGAYSTARKTYTFINKNLDIITNPGEAYLYCTATLTDCSDAAGLSAITNSIGVPANAGLIHGYSFDINDTTISTINDNLSSTLYAVNGGVFAESTTELDHIGWTKHHGFITEFHLKAATKVEIKIPLKSFVTALKDNKTMWGVKTQLKIIFPNNLNDQLFKFDASAIGSSSLVINTIELRMPYMKLENQKQLQLWSQMYSNTINKYWLDVDQYFSQSIVNTAKTDNETFRVAVKGLNSRPRWLLLHAVDTSTVATNDAKHKPMGFGGGGHEQGIKAAVDTQNSIRFKKLRIRLNGIYIDGGDVKEFDNVNAHPTANNAGNAATSAWKNHRGYMESYEEYSRFFGQYYDTRASPKSFNVWLAEQLYVFDLTNIDAESIFSNSGNALIIEVEYSTYVGTSTANSTIKLVANVMYDKQMTITHSDNKATLTIS
jgi:hypothetical protein